VTAAPQRKAFPDEIEHKVLLELWRGFSAIELQEKGEELALAEMQCDEIEKARRDLAADFAKQLKDLRGRISQLSKQIQTKGAERPTWCVVKFHEPRQAMKQIFRTDTGELVREEPMSEQECQQKLFHEPGEAG
jgi:hypothetical protein